MLDSNGAWKTSDSQMVDFSDFPNFDQTQGETGTSLVWIPQAKDRLFPVSSGFSSIRYIKLFPICSMAAVVESKFLSTFYTEIETQNVYLHILKRNALINI